MSYKAKAAEDAREQAGKLEYERRRTAEKMLAFAEMQAGPNPITPAELAALIEKRPEVWGVFRTWLAR